MISIAMAVYNGEEYIEKQLYSIVNQTLVPDEIVITDDSENDNTYNAAKKVMNECCSIKWNYVRNDVRLGYCKNFFKAISLTNGDIIFLSDQDDIWYKEKISKMSKCINSNSKIQCLCSKYICIDKNDKIISSIHEYSTSLYYRKNSKNNQYFRLDKEEYFKILAFPGFCFAITKSLKDKLHDFSANVTMENIKYHDLIISYLAARENSFYIYNENLNQYRMHSTNAIGIEYYNKGEKQDRVEWINNILKNQIDLYSYENIIQLNPKPIININENLFILNKLIRLNSMRIEYLKNKQLLKMLCLVFRKKYYLSIKSYLGDMNYILKCG